MSETTEEKAYTLTLSYDESIVLSLALDTEEEELHRLMHNRPSEKLSWEESLEKLKALQEKVAALEE